MWVCTLPHWCFWLRELLHFARIRSNFVPVMRMYKDLERPDYTPERIEQLEQDEVFVFGQRPYDDPRVSELNRRLRIDPTELQMQQAQPNGNLLGLIKYLIPKKWRRGGHKRQRAQHHDEVLREY